MPATLHRLRPRTERLRAEQADALRQLILALPGLPEHAAGAIIAAVDREAAAENRWTFVMLSPEQNDAVVNHLTKRSRRPLVAVRLWSLCFKHLRTDTGEILLTREGFAEKLGVEPKHISEIMTELSDMGAVIRRRERVGGMRGPGAYRSADLSAASHPDNRAEPRGAGVFTTAVVVESTSSAFDWRDALIGVLGGLGTALLLAGCLFLLMSQRNKTRLA